MVVSFVLFLFLWFVLFCETGSHYVTQVDPELMTSFLSLLQAGITSVWYYTWFLLPSDRALYSEAQTQVTLLPLPPLYLGLQTLAGASRLPQ